MKRHGIGLALGILLLPAFAAAGERLALAGAEASEGAYYSYLGAVLPAPGRAGGLGWLQRYWFDAYGYEYDSGTGPLTKARAYGVEAALGYGTRMPGGWASAYLGLRHADTDLSPDDPSAKARGGQTGLKLDVQGEQELAPGWRGNGIASVTSAERGWWLRGRLLHDLSPEKSLGGEVVVGGNDESRSRALGLVLLLKPESRPWSVGLKAGYRRDSDSDGIYAGFELGYGF